MGVTVADARVRETLASAALRPGWAVVCVGLLATGVGVVAALPPSAQYLPLLVSTVLLGIPHGAVDHLTPSRARGEAADARALLAVGVLYLLLGGAYAVAWAVAPVASFAFFILLTWVHWGQGDVYPLVALFEPSHLSDRRGRALAAVVRGGLPMVVPLVGSPTQYHDVATLVVGLFDPSASVAWLLRSDVRAALGGGLALVTVVALARGYRVARRRDARDAWRVDAAETLLLWAFFLVVPPVLAIGLYFPLWHSLRHIGRLVLLDPAGQSALAAGDPWTPLARFARDAAPLTAVSVVLLVGVGLAVPSGVGSLGDVVAAYLVLLAVLTLPHVVVVTALDRQQRVW